MSNKTVVIYHANCLDGIGAAWAAWKHLSKVAPDATYLPFHYDYKLNDSVVRGADVYLLDFSFKRETVLHIQKIVKSLTILDHHKTAHEEIGDLYNIDQTKSGAVLAWEHFHADPVPQILLHIQDRDLWQFKLPGTEDICSYLYSQPMNVRHFDTLAQMSVKDMATFGRVLTDYLHMEADKAIKTGSEITYQGQPIKVVNCRPALSSIVGHKLAEEYLFGMSFHHVDGKTIYSLRSVGDIDVSLIAKKFGGGGHKNAAGFTVESTLPIINQGDFK